MSNSMRPEEVVSMLNELFSMFDDLVEQYHPLTKIKTIGDCYMATIVPESKAEEDAVASANCSAVCHFALDMIEALRKFNDRHPDRTLNLRVGINSGEVVAGVVGTKRYLYDLWGDAVNLASRMESTGIPGKIQITPSVVNLIKNDFTTERRGVVHVKGIGEMETHLLVDRKVAPKKKRITPRKANKDYDYTLLMEGGSQMDLARSLRILQLSHRKPHATASLDDAGASLEDVEESDEKSFELSGGMAFELLKQSKRS